MDYETDEHTINKRIGANLRAIREFRGLTQQALAKAASVSFQQIQKYEKGTNRITGGKFVCFAHVLNVPITAFFDGVAVDVPEIPVLDFSKRHLKIIAMLEELDNPDIEKSLLAMLQSSVKD